MAHIPVLLKETIEGLALERGNVVLDGTVNGGGHSVEICRRLGGQGILIGIDRDSEALGKAKERLSGCGCKVFLESENFRNLDLVLRRLGISYINRALFDLGLSSNQLEESGRGFSFQKDEPLLMTFNPTPNEDELTAQEIVNKWEEASIADILYGYGDERFARRIARAIVRARSDAPIRTTGELAEIVIRALPSYRHREKIHPATKTFQALRIAVNDEIQSTEEGLRKAIDVLGGGGRIAVITFHSTEDRLVKNLFKNWQRDERGSVITKKPITPSLPEIRKNPRARSAKLRIFEKNNDAHNKKY